MFKQTIILISLLVSISSISFSQVFDLGKTKEVDISSDSSTKMDFRLVREIEFAQANNIDLKSVVIVGIMKTNSNIDTDREIRALSLDPYAKIRMVLRGQGGNIITFTTTLDGVMNLTVSPDIYSIQMSERLGGTAGVTVRN